MTSRERVLLALNHKEADRVPLDIGGMAQSGLHQKAYTALRNYYGLREIEPALFNIITQAAKIDEELADLMGTDCRLAFGMWGAPSRNFPTVQSGYLAFENEFAVGFRMPVNGGLYYDAFTHPLSDFEIAIKTYQFPNPNEKWRYEGLKAEMQVARKKNKFIVLMGMCTGVYEMGSALRGFQNYLVDILAEPKNVYYLADKISEMKACYWENALAEVGAYVDAINEADDMAGQRGLLFGVDAYRNLLKPYHTRIFSRVKKTAPHVKCILHSCGAVYEMIPDLIEAGVDVLNPVQYSAVGMSLKQLKADFGKDIVFWGGGIDTQSTLQNGTVEEIKDEVKRNIDTLAPGGGFVFSPVHIIQPSVPPENIAAMLEAVKEYGQY